MTKGTKGWAISVEKPKLTSIVGATKSQKQVLEVKVTLKFIKPEIWRTIIVDIESSLEELHQAIQYSMGWQSSHLYAFRLGGKRGQEVTTYSSEEFELDDSESAEETTLSDFVKAGIKEFVYEYDFGDGWEHTIKIVGKPKDAEVGKKHPYCLDGAMACPPEDCGGPHGYGRLVAVMSDPEDEEYEEMKEWLGKKFDPKKFSIAAANKDLKPLQN